MSVKKNRFQFQKGKGKKSKTAPPTKAVEGEAEAMAGYVARKLSEPVLVTYEELERRTGLGVDDRRYRQLADAGCFPAPHRGQYDLWPTIRGLLKHYRNAQTELAKKRLAISEEKHREIKRENDLADKLVVLRADVVSEFRQAVQPIRDLLKQKLENEYPPEVIGLDVPQARIYGRRLADDVLRGWQKLFDKWKI